MHQVIGGDCESPTLPWADSSQGGYVGGGSRGVWDWGPGGQVAGGRGVGGGPGDSHDIFYLY